MNRRDIVIGFIILAVVAGIIYFVRRPKTTPIETPVATPSFEEQFENKFNTQIPENLEKAELKDVTGQDNSGLATRNFENGTFSLTVLADLPDLESNNFYEAWLSRGTVGQSNYSLISIGKLQIAKGGFLLDFNSNTNYSDYQEVIVSQETKLGNTPAKIILDGSF
ncbi:hypothetical protein A2W13_02980 [Candidatus Woesebacteria bacterium RBG_16_36_11]|uniref:Anti-sigma factor n=1 Tax=Candidatus Woesebacteria bacterium RBG_16_36_11 TaxID=1802481 RepID=A0A1F7X864_9BACT|nr:MAG: hypothetical protein A2W13_02980 [Candidatus Woesebacteria bacterium RBG_16_36_11]